MDEESAMTLEAKGAEPVTVLEESAEKAWRCWCLNLDRETVVREERFLYQIPSCEF